MRRSQRRERFLWTGTEKVGPEKGGGTEKVHEEVVKISQGIKFDEMMLGEVIVHLAVGMM